MFSVYGMYVCMCIWYVCMWKKCTQNRDNKTITQRNRGGAEQKQSRGGVGHTRARDTDAADTQKKGTSPSPSPPDPSIDPSPTPPFFLPSFLRIDRHSHHCRSHTYSALSLLFLGLSNLSLSLSLSITIAISIENRSRDLDCAFSFAFPAILGSFPLKI